MKRKHWSGTVSNFRNDHFWRWGNETTKSVFKKKTFKNKIVKRKQTFRGGAHVLKIKRATLSNDFDSLKTQTMLWRC